MLHFIFPITLCMFAHMRTVITEKFPIPSEVWSDGRVEYRDDNGLLNDRFGVPAVIWPDGTCERYCNGVFIGNENRRNIDDEISDILNGFEFNKVSITMHALDWKWMTKSLVWSIPRIPEIRKTAKRLLLDAHEGAFANNVNEFSVSTGGFEATYTKNLGFKLVFYVDEFQTF